MTNAPAQETTAPQNIRRTPLEKLLEYKGYTGVTQLSEPSAFESGKQFALFSSWAEAVPPQGGTGTRDLYVAVLRAGEENKGPTEVQSVLKLPVKSATSSADAHGREFGSGNMHITSSLVGDIDADQKSEVALTVRYGALTPCGTGFIRYHHHYIVNLQPKIHLGFDAITSIDNVSGEPHTEGSAIIDDLNADGHADVALRRRQYRVDLASQESILVKKTFREYHWQQASDQWELSRSEATDRFSNPSQDPTSENPAVNVPVTNDPETPLKHHRNPLME